MCYKTDRFSFIFSFLNQTDSEMYKLYQMRVFDLVEAKKRAEADGHLMTFDRKSNTTL